MLSQWKSSKKQWWVLFSLVALAANGSPSAWAMSGGRPGPKTHKTHLIRATEADYRAPLAVRAEIIRLQVPSTGIVPVKVLIDETLRSPMFRVELAAESDATLQQLQNEFHVSESAEGALVLEHRSTNYQCEVSRRFDGVMEIGGSCIRSISVILPSAFGTKVYAGDELVYGSMNLNDLMAILKNPLSFLDAKMAALAKFMTMPEHAERFLTAQQASEVLAQFPFDHDKEKAAQLLSGHLSDPENAASVARQFMFDEQRYRSIEVLSH